MDIAKTLSLIISLLERSKTSYALAGGLVANLYRSEARLTNDIDIAVLANAQNIDSLSALLKQAHLSVGQVKEGDLQKIPFPKKRSKTPVQILVGRNPDQPEATGVDLLLSNMLWVPNAIARAQYNKINIFKQTCPCLTIEDLLLSKLHALSNNVRYKDLDDLEELFKKQKDFDHSHLIGRMLEYKLTIPKEIRKKVQIDAELGRVAREIERELRKSN